MALLERLIAEGKTRLRIGGRWRDAADGARIEVRDPATEAVIAEVASGTVEDAVDAVGAAEAAATEWAASPPRRRSDVLRRAFELLIEREREIGELITLENGKALSDSIGEIRYGAEFFRWFSEEAVRIRGDLLTAPGGDKRIVVLPQPVGISVLVTPWNFPLAMATRKVGPALAAGCTAILKPASDTPLTALAMVDILEEAGMPPGVLNVVPAHRSGPVVGAMLEDPRVRKLSFTGSTETGKALLATASRRVLRTSMELGGNAPFLVFAGADLEAAVEGALIAKMRNAGEACTSANRFLVEDSVADEFADRLAAAMGSLRVGGGLEPGVDVGPLVNAATRDKVAALVEGATGGGTVLVGGAAPTRRGYFYLPTVIKDVARSAGILQTEIFGPVAPIVRFSDVDDAVAQANDTPLGLVSYLYAGDRGLAMDVAERLEAGMVGVNRGLVSDPAAPFGGWKESGLGREGSYHGMDEYLETKYIATD